MERPVLKVQGAPQDPKEQQDLLGDLETPERAEPRAVQELPDPLELAELSECQEVLELLVLLVQRELRDLRDQQDQLDLKDLQEPQVL